MTHEQMLYLLVLLSSFALLLSEKLRTDVVALLIILALYGTGILDAQQALQGFSSEPAITVAAVFVLSAGIHHAGISHYLGRIVGHLAGRGLRGSLCVLMPVVALLSAFSHHVTSTAVMLPVTMELCRKKSLPASKLLMPMAFAASLGTTMTLIGAPAFLLVSGLLEETGRSSLSLFSITPIGVSLLLLSMLFMQTLGFYLLPLPSAVQQIPSTAALDLSPSDIEPESDAAPKLCTKAFGVLGILALTIFLAVSGLFRVEMASLLGAVLMVLTGCLNLTEAYQAIDSRIYVFIAGALPLGFAMQKTGTADLLAQILEERVVHFPEWAVLAIFFAVVAIATQFMSDAGTTAIFAPLAIAMAYRRGYPPEPYAITVAMASVAAFMTPIGHHGNLLVYNPGRYRFSDFIKVGTPLTVLIGAVVILWVPYLWPHEKTLNALQSVEVSDSANAVPFDLESTP